MTWEWSEAAHRYRNTDTGRFMSNEQMLAVRDTFIDSQRQYAGYNAREVVDGNLSKAEWEQRMREQVGTTFIDEYALGKGGRYQMTGDDWVKVAGMLDSQYQYLGQFATDLDNLSEAEIAARSGLYFNSATQAYEKGRAASWEMPELEQVPGDGQTQCMSNCKCNLDIKETETGWDVYWKLGQAEHCDDCVNLSQQWNPLKLEPA